MPAGLDGNPNPIVTSARTAVIREVADAVRRLPARRRLVAVDGRSGSGKSTFADELGSALAEDGTVVVRATIDSFHLPRQERLARGDTSPISYVEDSHQLDSVVDELLVPFRAGETDVLVAAFDEPGDRADRRTAHDVPLDAVLVFDGLFLHRRELVDHWDLTAYLDADGRIDQRWLTYLTAELPEDPTARSDELDRRLTRARWPRYRDGWRLYVDLVDPAASATFVVDNEDLAAPTIRRRG